MPKCLICGYERPRLDKHIFNAHYLTKVEYLKRFPGAETQTLEIHEKLSQNLKSARKKYKDVISLHISLTKKGNPKYRDIAIRSLSKIEPGKGGRATKGSRRSLEFRLWFSEKFKGPKNPNWKDGTSKNHNYYLGSDFGVQKRRCYERDKFTCQACGKKYDLQCHHIEPYRISHNNSLDNLITLCRSCHFKFEHLTRRELYNIINKEGENYAVLSSNWKNR